MEYSITIQNGVQVVNIKESAAPTVNIPVEQTIQFNVPAAQGVPGGQGLQGEQGVQGPEFTGENLPDFSLIFDNKLI